MNKVAIEFSLTGKIYKKGFWGTPYQALKDLNLQIPEGTIFGFLGANGAGKTTAIKILMGLQKATTGEILLWGENPELNKHRVGYLPERPYFHENLSAEEFLYFHKSLYPYEKNKKQISNDELLDLVGLKHAKKKLLKEFSKGMLQRIGIAQSLVNNPDLIILDEPMSGLDPIGRREVRNLIQNLAHQGKTIFFSSHILSDVESLCHQIAFLEKGVLSFAGKVDTILKRNSTEEEILFHGLSNEKIRTIPLLAKSQRMGEAWKLLTQNPQATKMAIEAIWQNDGQLLGVHAFHQNLEDALFGLDLVKQGGTANE